MIARAVVVHSEPLSPANVALLREWCDLVEEPYPPESAVCHYVREGEYGWQLFEVGSIVVHSYEYPAHVEGMRERICDMPPQRRAIYGSYEAVI